MGQKVHPYGFRLGYNKTWNSKWFSTKQYMEFLHEDLRIRKFIKKKLYHAGISKVVIDRTGDKVVLNIHTARPGILIGKRGAEVETLRAELAGFTDWVLPSLEDLETLLRPMAQGAYNLPGKFTLTACCPWSSTTKSEQSAWNFNFQFSKPFSGAFSYTYDHRALCRRLPLEEERALIESLQKEARKKKVPKK